MEAAASSDGARGEALGRPNRATATTRVFPGRGDVSRSTFP